jgi:hypothetical protein
MAFGSNSELEVSGTNGRVGKPIVQYWEKRAFANERCDSYEVLDATDVCCLADSVAKVPKRRATKFPLNYKTSGNRRSMQSQTRHRSRQ